MRAPGPPSWPAPRRRAAGGGPRRWSPLPRRIARPRRTRTRSPRRPARWPTRAAGPERWRGRWSGCARRRSQPRQGAGYEPDASTRCGASYTWRATAIRPAVRSSDQPALTGDDVDAARGDQPGQAPVQPADHAVGVRLDPGQVDLVDRAWIPNWAPSRAASATSAACRIALVGMQPRCRQVPPTLSFSTRPTAARAGPRAGRRRSPHCPPRAPAGRTDTAMSRRSSPMSFGVATILAPWAGFGGRRPG